LENISLFYLWDLVDYISFIRRVGIVDWILILIDYKISSIEKGLDFIINNPNVMFRAEVLKKYNNVTSNFHETIQIEV